MGSWHAVYIVCILESYKLKSEPYLTSGTLKNGATEPITQGLVRPCTANVLADVVVVVTHALTATSRLEHLEVGRLRSRAECPSMLKLK